MMWIIWKARNRCIFYGEKRSVYSIIQQVITTVRDLPPCAVKKRRCDRVIGMAPVISYPCGFMDGASKYKIAGGQLPQKCQETHT